MKNLFTVIGMLLFFCSYAPPEDSKASNHSTNVSAQIDQYVKETLHQFEIPGASVAVIKNGKIIHKQHYGFANLEHQVPVSDQSIFRVYSLTKPIVSVGVFQLIEQGKWSLEDKISLYVEDLPESWKHLQIKHLLTHSSGLPDMAPIPEFKDLSEDAAKAKVFAQDIKFSAGTQYDYNQTNFWLLQSAIEKITALPIEEYILNNQFPEKPETVFFSSDSRDIVPNRATAYFPFSKGKLTIDHPYLQGDYAYAMNGLNISLDAFIDWDSRLNNDQLLNPATKAAMLQSFPYTNTDKAFSYGWDRRELNGHVSFGFSGSMVTAYRIFPDDKLSIFFLGNGMGKWFNIEKVINRIANIVNENIFDINDHTLNELFEAAQNNGYQAFLSKYKDLQAQYTGQNVAFENHLNSIGYYFLNIKNFSLALSIFELNTKEFPQSWNPFDSLAEAYEISGNKKEALKNYEKAFRLLSKEDIDNKNRLQHKITTLQ